MLMDYQSLTKWDAHPSCEMEYDGNIMVIQWVNNGMITLVFQRKEWGNGIRSGIKW